MPIEVIDKIKQKNNGTFKLINDYDIEWHTDNTTKIPTEALSDDVVTSSELADAIAAAPHMKRSIVTTLPALSDADELTIYMLASGSEDQNRYTEYVKVNDKWEKLGGSTVDLSDYYKKSEVDSKVKTATDAASAASSAATAAETNAKSYADQKFVPLAGGTMTGKLVLSGDPTNSSEAATKNYVDSVASGVTPEGMITATDITTGSANGTIAVKNTDVAVKGLRDAAYTTVSNILSQVSIDWHEIS